MDKSKDRSAFCEGAQDEVGAVCEGENIKWYLVETSTEDFIARWCADCKAIAASDGFNITEIREFKNYGMWIGVKQDREWWVGICIPLRSDGTMWVDQKLEIEVWESAEMYRSVCESFGVKLTGQKPSGWESVNTSTEN